MIVRRPKNKRKNHSDVSVDRKCVYAERTYAHFDYLASQWLTQIEAFTDRTAWNEIGKPSASTLNIIYRSGIQREKYGIDSFQSRSFFGFTATIENYKLD